ncbi:MAG: 2TM domain-containing protein [Solibacillus sp.]
MENDRYKKAQKRVKELKGFYIHLLTYILVNIGLITINITSSAETNWFIYPLLGWGIGVGAHAVSIFFGGKWEERKIEEYLNK